MCSKQKEPPKNTFQLINNKNRTRAQPWMSLPECRLTSPEEVMEVGRINVPGECDSHEIYN